MKSNKEKCKHLWRTLGDPTLNKYYCMLCGENKEFVSSKKQIQKDKKSIE